MNTNINFIDWSRYNNVKPSDGNLGIASLNDVKENAGMVVKLDRSVSLIADADTGYGGRHL